MGELLDGIVERGASIMANRVRALISKIYNFGLGRDLVDHSPCHGVPMPAKAMTAMGISRPVVSRVLNHVELATDLDRKL